MQESDQAIFQAEEFPSLLCEIMRIKRSNNPITILSLFLSQYSTPTNCFSPSNETNMFDKSIYIFLSEMKQVILPETIQFISFLDFQLSIGYQLKNSDYYLLHKIFSMYPDVLKNTVPIVISSQHPLEFLSIFVLNPHFNQNVFQYQLKQKYTEDADLLNRILQYVSKNKCAIHQSLYNNFSRFISTKSLDETLKDNDIIPILEPIKYDKQPKPLKSLSISNSLTFDKDNKNISEDIQSVQLLDSQSYQSKQNNQLKKAKPYGSAFYVDAKAPSGKARTKSCKIDKDDNSSVTIVPKKSLNKDIIIFILISVIVGLISYILWQHMSKV